MKISYPFSRTFGRSHKKRLICYAILLQLMAAVVCLNVSCGSEPADSFSKNNMKFPKTLDELKLFSGNMAELVPADDVQVVELSSTLFTDYTEKQRLVRLPAGTNIIATDDNLPDFPEGTLLAKTFFYTAGQTGGEQKLIETRILIKNKGLWNVATYIWDEEQKNAKLTYDGATVPVKIITPDGFKKQIDYKVPTVYNCYDCHRNNNQLTPIGPKLRNLNRTISINGREVDQLDYLEDRGFLKIKGRKAISKLPAFTDNTVPLDQRARAYFEINCAHCHNPGGLAGSYSINFPFEVDYKNTGIFANKWNIEHRMTIRDMPKLGTTVIDKEGLKLVKQYLASLKKP